MNIEILRNTLYKAYLDDFARFCTGLGGATAEIMGDLLSFEVAFAAAAIVHPPYSPEAAWPVAALHLTVVLKEASAALQQLLHCLTS